MKTGLALSGGAVRGIAHIGVLKYLEENNIEIDLVAGTSAGSLVGALYAAGKSASEIEEIVRDIHWKDILKYIYSVSFPKKGLINIEFLKKIIDRHLGNPSFDQLKKPLIIVAVDLLKNRAIFLDSGDVTSAVMASSAIPGIFTPVERDGLILVDGGVLQNVPTAPLAQAGVDNIIAVNLNAHSLPEEPPQSIFDILYRTILIKTRDGEQEDMGRADFALKPAIGHVGLWELDKAEELVELGYEEARKVLGDAKMKKSLWEKILPR